MCTRSAGSRANAFTLPPRRPTNCPTCGRTSSGSTPRTCARCTLLRFLLRGSLPLSPVTGGLAALVARMAAASSVSGAEALRQRRNHWARQVALGFCWQSEAILVRQAGSRRHGRATLFLMAARVSCHRDALAAAAAAHACTRRAGSPASGAAPEHRFRYGSGNLPADAICTQREKAHTGMRPADTSLAHRHGAAADSLSLLPAKGTRCSGQTAKNAEVRPPGTSLHQA